jgi:hypothetical protein
MTRVRVHETAGGRGRFIGADENTSGTTDQRNDTMDFKEQLIAEGEAREREFERMLAGDFTRPKRAGDVDLTVNVEQTIGAISARDAHLAREAARSRRPARGATREMVSEIDDGDDDDGGAR